MWRRLWINQVYWMNYCKILNLSWTVLILLVKYYLENGKFRTRSERVRAIWKGSSSEFLLILLWCWKMEICQYFKCGYCKSGVHVENGMSKKYAESMVARKLVLKDIQKYVELLMLTDIALLVVTACSSIKLTFERNILIWKVM